MIKKLKFGMALAVGLITSNVFAGTICNENKINEVFAMALANGAKVISKEESKYINGFCEVVLNFNGKNDLIFLDAKNDVFIGGGQLISYDKTSKQYTSLAEEKFAKLDKERVKALFSDNKELDKYFKVAKEEFSKDAKNEVLNKRYDILVFTSKVCPHCANLHSDLSVAFEKDNIKIHNYYIPISQADYADLKQNVYGNEDELKTAIDMHNKIGGGVPTVLVRDKTNGEFVDFIQGLKNENLESLFNYIKTQK